MKYYFFQFVTKTCVLDFSQNQKKKKKKNQDGLTNGSHSRTFDKACMFEVGVARSPFQTNASWKYTKRRMQCEHSNRSLFKDVVQSKLTVMTYSQNYDY